MNKPAFPGLPCKPQVTRLPDGRIGIFIGDGYRFTDDAGLASLRQQIDELMPAPTPSPGTRYRAAESEFCRQLAAELKAFEPRTTEP